MIEHAGIYRMTLEEYLADPAPEPSLNASIVQVLHEQSPLHAMFKHPRLNPALVRQHASNFDVGTAFHALLLEGADVFIVVDAPDWKKKAAQKERAAIRKAGKVPLLIAQRAQIGAMHAAVLRALSNYPELPVPFTNGEPERTLVWKEQGVWLRSRPDWLTGDGRHAWDLKTPTASAHPIEWQRTLFSTGADIQAEMIQRGTKKLLGVEPVVTFVVVETDPPYGVSLVTLDPEAEERARIIVLESIETWGECLKTKKWPGYPLRPVAMELPAWLRMKSEIRSFYHRHPPTP